MMVNALLWLWALRVSSQADFRFGWLDAAVAAFFLWQLLSTAWSVFPRFSLEENLYVAGAFPLFLAARDYAKGAGRIRLLKVFATTAAGLVSVGLLIWFIVICTDRVPVDTYRAAATLDNSNLYSGILLLLIPAIYLRAGRKSGRRAAAVLSLASLGILALTWSRSGWLGALAGLTASAVILSSKKWRAASAISFMLISILAGLLLFMPGRRTSNIQRIEYWSDTARMSWRQPVTGYGYGAFPYAYYQWKKTCDASGEYALPYHAHNIFIHSWAETGFVGLLLLLGILSYALYLSAKALSGSSPGLRLLGAVSIAALAGLIVHHTFNYYAGYPSLAFPLWMIMGGVSSLEQKNIRIGLRCRAIMRPFIALLLLILTILAVKIGIGRIYADKGFQQYMSGDYAGALRSLSSAIKADGGLPLYYAGRGTAEYALYSRDKKRSFLDAAIDDHKAAVSLPHPEPYYLYNLASLYAVGGQTVLAEATWRQAISLRALLARDADGVDRKDTPLLHGSKIMSINRDNAFAWNIMVNKRWAYWRELSP